MRESYHVGQERGDVLQPEVERELVRLCKAGGARFYEPIVRAYEGPGLRIALGMLGSPDEAQDALQEAFVKAWQSLPRFDVERPFGPWFFRILRNHCWDVIRSQRSRSRFETRDEKLELRPAGVSSDPEYLHMKTEAKELLWKALSEVGDEHREILVLKELEDLRYAEIASILDVPEGTVASRLYHARRALRSVLLEMNVEYP